MDQRAVGSIALLLLTGCAIAARSDKFGADLDIGIGGIIGYIADVRLKASVGFSKTCKETKDDQGAGDPDPLGVDHFL
jgi:hypothetical protein